MITDCKYCYNSWLEFYFKIHYRQLILYIYHLYDWKTIAENLRKTNNILRGRIYRIFLLKICYCVVTYKYIVKRPDLSYQLNNKVNALCKVYCH